MSASRMVENTQYCTGKVNPTSLSWTWRSRSLGGSMHPWFMPARLFAAVRDLWPMEAALEWFYLCVVSGAPISCTLPCTFVEVMTSSGIRPFYIPFDNSGRSALEETQPLPEIPFPLDSLGTFHIIAPYMLIIGVGRKSCLVNLQTNEIWTFDHPPASVIIIT